MMASDLEEEMFNKFTNATKGTKYARQLSPTHQKNPKSDTLKTLLASYGDLDDDRKKTLINKEILTPWLNEGNDKLTHNSFLFYLPVHAAHIC